MTRATAQACDLSLRRSHVSPEAVAHSHPCPVLSLRVSKRRQADLLHCAAHMVFGDIAGTAPVYYGEHGVRLIA